MKTQSIFREYIWLVNTIRRAGKISLSEINDKYRQTDMSGGLDFSRSTFNRHKDAIQDIFGIYIECDRRNGHKYYIGNSNVLSGDTVQNWMLSSISVSNIISESLSIQDRIIIESIPEDSYLEPLMEAMKKNLRVEIEYRRFGAEDSRTFTFDPYALKTYHRRWYVIAHFEREAREGETPVPRKGLPKGFIEYYGTFSFDRIEKVTVLKEKFKLNPEFSAEEFFKDSFGIVTGDGTPKQKVVLRAYGKEAYNLITLPLHHSQQPINRTFDYTDFELTLKPTLDFQGKILSRGKWLEVLEPETLREDIKTMLKETQNRYE